MHLSSPETLSARKRYKQAIELSHKTSRSSNPDWYKDSLGINLQLHIFVGSDSGAISYIRNTSESSWAKGPNISPEAQANPELLNEILQGIYNEHLSKQSKPSMGVILYVADEFSTAELGPEHQNPAEIDELRKLIIENPSSILEDQTISNETHSWRLFPYPGASGGNAFATAISLSRKHDKLLSYLREYGRENNFPINTRAVSAPLCTISALPWLLEHTPENGFVTALHYPRFTVLAFFNVHGDLILIRTLQHHGNAPFAPNTASAINTTATSLELSNPHVFILPMAGQPPMGLSGSISSIMPDSEVITLSPTSSQLHIPTAPSASGKKELLGMTRPWKWSDLTAQTKLESESSAPTQEDQSASAIPGVTRPWRVQDMAATAMLSQVRLEVVSTTNPPTASNSPLAESHTFSTLVREMWPIQDFLPAPTEETSLFPGQFEMKIIRFGRLLKLSAATLVLGFAGYSAFSYIRAKSHEAWGYEPGLAQMELMKYQKDLASYNTWNNLLQERSLLWSNMELLTRMFPEQPQVVINDYSYSTQISAPVKNEPMVAFSRTWRIRGEATDASKKHLFDLNTKNGITKLFREVYKVTGDESFNPDVYRRAPNVDITFNSMNTRSSSSTFTVSFDITIIQSFNDNDPLMITVN
ncbi:hypothetical protein SAMN02745181_3620 [Rubritalea squalenifaciens DSM 18772]|uniref:Uncharacterized protein n=1 Tax=Rubritalea squalenifaciens DSM 18772 TaxID=1123071 RepID=A0A1M6RJV1_9BACT|nr:hypothetical protein [Rubritalea squalenifaciens]SHK32699.1 hypothetical protein SAMN02745181_3620 [Rubritalea squalenifaciens DSM 18772]